ncbi:MAG: hypothetical protein NTZ07_02900 [Candidatus Woesebacteria bacterium]|nr:hypothetical protein [Candidatus Woesebacteria bacterium]
MIKRLVLSIVLVLLVACSGKASVATPTSVPTALPTTEAFAYPTPIPCNTDIGNADIQTKLETLADAKEVRIMEVHKGYSIFWSDGSQICTPLDRNNVDIHTYYVTTDGLTDEQYLGGYASEDAVANWQYYGTADVEYATDSYNHVDYITLQTPMTVGPNDAVVMAAWPSQLLAIKRAVQYIFVESPVYFDSPDWNPTPQQACDEMARWEGFVPLPDNIYPICHISSWLYGYPHMWLVDPPQDTYLFTAYLVFLKIPDQNFFEGPLQVGQKLGDYTVEETCVPLIPDQLEIRPGNVWAYKYSHPFGIKLGGIDGYITVPESGVVGFGPYSTNTDYMMERQGWHLFSVCP